MICNDTFSITLFIIICIFQLHIFYLMWRNNLIFNMRNRITEKIFKLPYKKWQIAIHRYRDYSYEYCLYGRLFTPIKKLEEEINNKVLKGGKLDK